MGEFIGGLELSGQFYREVVRPALDRHFPDLHHSAALIGYGSEVLGYDTPVSTDHEWGPSVLLFLREDEYGSHADRISQLLGRELPATFRGYSAHFGPPVGGGARVAGEAGGGPIAQKVEVHTVRGFFGWWVGLDPSEEMGVADWLSVPEQKLLEVTAGRVFHDGLGELGPIRERLAYYPRDVWLYLLAAQWRRIGQGEAFVGRTGDAGDELGSRLVAASQVRDLMKLCFLMERQYAPYAKWFGTGFSRLGCAPDLAPVLDRALLAGSWREREGHLSDAYEYAARMHNALGITDPLDAEVSPFYDRPYLVIHADRFASAIGGAIADPEVRSIGFAAGSVDQFVDSTDVLTNPIAYRRLRTLYE